MHGKSNENLELQRDIGQWKYHHGIVKSIAVSTNYGTTKRFSGPLEVRRFWRGPVEGPLSLSFAVRSEAIPINSP